MDINLSLSWLYIYEYIIATNIGSISIRFLDIITSIKISKIPPNKIFLFFNLIARIMHDELTKKSVINIWENDNNNNTRSNN